MIIAWRAMKRTTVAVLSYLGNQPHNILPNTLPTRILQLRGQKYLIFRDISSKTTLSGSGIYVPHRHGSAYP